MTPRQWNKHFDMISGISVFAFTIGLFALECGKKERTRFVGMVMIASGLTVVIVCWIVGAVNGIFLGDPPDELDQLDPLR